MRTINFHFTINNFHPTNALLQTTYKGGLRVVVVGVLCLWKASRRKWRWILRRKLNAATVFSCPCTHTHTHTYFDREKPRRERDEEGEVRGRGVSWSYMAIHISTVLRYLWNFVVEKRVFIFGHTSQHLHLHPKPSSFDRLPPLFRARQLWTEHIRDRERRWKRMCNEVSNEFQNVLIYTASHTHKCIHLKSIFSQRWWWSKT